MHVFSHSKNPESNINAVDDHIEVVGGIPCRKLGINQRSEGVGDHAEVVGDFGQSHLRDFFVSAV